jgi:hypothetical protein
MEATCEFYPPYIDWKARGVDFKFGPDPGAPFSLRLMRRKIATWLAQFTTADYRIPVFNDAAWVYDGLSKKHDTQYPSTDKPNRAFTIDAPGFKPSDFSQGGFRADLREVAEWYDGSGWRQITSTSSLKLPPVI